MSDKVTVVFNSKTRHILGAVTRKANPTSKIDASQLANPHLVLRGGPGQPPSAGAADFAFRVSHESLKAAVVDMNLSVLRNPLQFAVDDAQKDSPSLQELPIHEGSPPQPMTLTISALSQTALTVTLVPVPATTDFATTKRPVWVQIEHESLPAPLAFPDELAPGPPANLKLPTPIPKGNGYRILVLAANAAIQVGSLNVT